MVKRDLKIEILSADKGVTVVRLSGELDAHTFQSLDKALQKLFVQQHYKIVMDMGGVVYLSSAGIGTLVSATIKCNANGGNLIMCKVTDRCNDVLTLLGLNETLQFADDLQPALARF